MESETLREITPGLEGGRAFCIISVVKEGRLYLASRAGKQCVLKCSDGSAKGIEMLKREYSLSLGLSHPGLASVIAYEEDSPVGPCIVQEYIDGDTLAEWLAGKPGAGQRRMVVSELLSVMAYLHRKGVIHNDLKPENILISRTSGSLKLIDFGFADNDAFSAKALGGTRAYASPELLSGMRVDARSDVYSIGLLLRDVFPGRYRRLVRRCLKVEPSGRFSSAGEVERAWRRRWLPFFRVALFVVVAVGLSFAADAYLTRRAADAWYAREVPAFREALSASGTAEEVYAAWATLASSYSDALNTRSGEHISSRYNDVFPGLQEELARKLRELGQ